jgi:hypothetical protein
VAVNAAISWGAPNALRRRGKHRLTLKQRLTSRSAKRNRWTRDDIYLALVQVAIPGAVRWGAEELRRAQPRHNAGKSARTAMMLIPVGALAATLHNPLTWPVYMATCALWVPAAVIGVSWLWPRNC